MVVGFMVGALEGAEDEGAWEGVVLGEIVGVWEG